MCLSEYNARKSFDSVTFIFILRITINDWSICSNHYGIVCSKQYSSSSNEFVTVIASMFGAVYYYSNYTIRSQNHRINNAFDLPIGDKSKQSNSQIYFNQNVTLWLQEGVLPHFPSKHRAQIQSNWHPCVDVWSMLWIMKRFSRFFMRKFFLCSQNTFFSLSRAQATQFCRSAIL